MPRRSCITCLSVNLLSNFSLQSLARLNLRRTRCVSFLQPDQGRVRCYGNRIWADCRAYRSRRRHHHGNGRHQLERYLQQGRSQPLTGCGKIRLSFRGGPLGPNPEPKNTGQSPGFSSRCSWVPGSLAALRPRNDGDLGLFQQPTKGRIRPKRRPHSVAFTLTAGAIQPLVILSGPAFREVNRRSRTRRNRLRAISSQIGCLELVEYPFHIVAGCRSSFVTTMVQRSNLGSAWRL